MQSVRYLHWQFDRLMSTLIRTGWLFPCVLLICTASVALAGYLLLQARHDWASSARERNVLLHANATSAVEPNRALANRIGAVLNQLPEATDGPQALADIFDLAQKENLTLNRGDYSQLPVDVAGIARFRMTFPVKGDAQNVERFLFKALENHRGLSFESIQVKRLGVESSVVEAKIQWSLLMQPQTTQRISP